MHLKCLKYRTPQGHFRESERGKKGEGRKEKGVNVSLAGLGHFTEMEMGVAGNGKSAGRD